MRTRIWWALLVLFVPGVASAQYSVPSQASSTERIEIAQGDPVQIATDEPLRWEIGGSLNFLTSDPTLDDQELKFTDLVLLRLHALVSPTNKLSIFGGVDVLPKQPSYTNELGWQGALLGARYLLDESFAVWARGSGGPLLDRAGYWVAGDAAGQYKLELDKTLFFESALGTSYTQLFFDQDTDKPFLLSEAFAEVGLAVREKSDDFALWLRFDYFYPLAGHPNSEFPDRATDAALDPQPRVNFHLGCLAAVSKSLALFIEWSILDRGDYENPETTLPILNRGFDQEQLVFGFMRRFGNE